MRARKKRKGRRVGEFERRDALLPRLVFTFYGRQSKGISSLDAFTIVFRRLFSWLPVFRRANRGNSDTARARSLISTVAKVYLPRSKVYRDAHMPPPLGDEVASFKFL